MATFVRAKNGKAQLFTASQGVIQTFGNNVETAMLQGDEIIVTTKNGRTEIYRLNQSGKGVVGPIKTL
jgi:hypothetical protein